jgi:hypothetical protein
MYLSPRKKKSKNRQTHRRRAVPFRTQGHTIKSRPIDDEPLIRPARVLLLDVESTPLLAYAWSRWRTNLIEVAHESYLLSAAWKWLGEKQTHVRALCDYPRYKTDKADDRELVKQLYDVINSSDVVVAHNGDRFDLKKIAARFIYHGLTPPAPHKSIDTLKISRSRFGFSSHKLARRHCQAPRARAQGSASGHFLWLGCMMGDAASWRLMKTYNRADVDLLEPVYLRLRSWTKHPVDLTLWSREEHACPTCESHNIDRRGYLPTRKSWKRRLHCLDCGAWWNVKIGAA